MPVWDRVRPVVATFSISSSTALAILDRTVMSQSLVLAGPRGTVTGVSIGLDGLTHGFSDDIDMLLLGPGGLTNIMFWSDAGGTTAFDNAAIVIGDSAPSQLPDSGPIVSGLAYQPAAYQGLDENVWAANFGSPQGGIHYPQTDSTATFASAFGGSQPAGTWTLFVADDANGDSGVLGGWTLTIETDSPNVVLKLDNAADSFVATATSATGGSWSLNGAGSVVYDGVAGFHVNGGGGSDTLTGGDGPDELRGSAGADLMTGGLGNDRYFVSEAGDEVVEASPAGGNDTVFSLVGYALGANLEILRLQGTAGLAGAGNALNNRIFGNSGDNLLQGLGGNDALTGNKGNDTLDGGAGNDTLTGGPGADVFRFANANAGVDRILDFNKNGDRFDLSGGSFTALSIAPNGDAVLTHAGGAVRIAEPAGLTLAQWNALVLPASGKAADGPHPAQHDAPASDDLSAGSLAHAAALDEPYLAHADWSFA